MRSDLPPEVAPLLDELLPAIHEALADNLVGVYLRGSIALGGFDLETSDVDLMVVTERAVSESEFAKLADLHDRVPPKVNKFGRSYEVSYIDRGSLRRFTQDERVHPTVGADWPFARSEHPDNFVVERWVTREHGVVLHGPNPKTLIEPISPDDLRVAIRSEFARHMVWVSANDPPGWLATRYYQAFAIETICRGLYTLETGNIATKRQAVDWAIKSLPDRWRFLAEWSREHHSDKTADETNIPHVMEFIAWATSAPLPRDVRTLLDALLPAIREALPGNFVGAYLTGSLALGCFDPRTSDVDVLVITESPVSDAEFAALKALHERIPLETDGLRPEYEVFYIDRPTIRRFAPGQQHVKAEPGYGLFWAEHRPSWVIERWTAREHGVTLAGPDPKTLIDPVSEDEIRRAAASELRKRRANWEEGVWPLADLGHRGSQGYEIETACRVLCTVETGAITSKPDALAWARGALPEEWHSLLDFAEQYRKDRTQDMTQVDEVLAFVRYAVGRASMSAG